jgi:hypothetical protein
MESAPAASGRAADSLGRRFARLIVGWLSAVVEGLPPLGALAAR